MGKACFPRIAKRCFLSREEQATPHSLHHQMPHSCHADRACLFPLSSQPCQLRRLSAGQHAMLPFFQVSALCRQPVFSPAVIVTSFLQKGHMPALPWRRLLRQCHMHVKSCLPCRLPSFHYQPCQLHAAAAAAQRQPAHMPHEPASLPRSERRAFSAKASSPSATACLSSLFFRHATAHAAISPGVP